MMMFLYSQTFSKDSSAIFQSYIIFLFNTTCFGSCPVHVWYPTKPKYNHQGAPASISKANFSDQLCKWEGFHYIQIFLNPPCIYHVYHPYSSITLINPPSINICCIWSCGGWSCFDCYWCGDCFDYCWCAHWPWSNVKIVRMSIISCLILWGWYQYYDMRIITNMMINL